MRNIKDSYEEEELIDNDTYEVDCLCIYPNGVSVVNQKIDATFFPSDNTIIFFKNPPVMMPTNRKQIKRIKP